MMGVEPGLRVAGCGFLFWAAFLLALDSDLIFGAVGGWPPAIGEDAVRILFASSLGAGMAAIQLVLVDRFPVVRRRPANLAVHLGACLGLSFAALVVARAGAPLVLASTNPRLKQSLGEVIAADLFLVAFALGAFALLLHLLRRPDASTPAPSAKTHAIAQTTRIPVQTRDGVVLVEADAVDWIEAQGNYAALHVGAETHLVRETLTGLSERLDPERFVRIHRSLIVNLARIMRMKPLASGDALVELADGTELRASRTYAGKLREEFQRNPAPRATATMERS
jgi:DNA-binding LytR/AlgR family response regulator